jgi:RecA/RadA recombinase
MVDWMVTATTIYCDAIEDEVTLIVHKDGGLKCTGFDKYSKADKEAVKSIMIKSKQLGKQLGCEGLECRRVTEYQGKLLTGEAGARRSIGSE